MSAGLVDDREPVYQPRCVMCAGEHYALNAIGVSHGEAPCHNCGQKSPVFYREVDYRAALRDARERQAARRLRGQT